MRDERFCLSNPLWRHEPLGWGLYTIGTAGCLLCALAKSLTSIRQQVIQPPRLNRWLRRNGGYSGSEIVFGPLATLGLHLVERPDYRGLGGPLPVAELERLADLYDAGNVIILQVDASWRGGFQEHWVLVTEVYRDPVLYPNGIGVHAFDALTARVVDVGAMYAHPDMHDLRTAIYGAAIFEAMAQ